jgi:hypothetical protein
MQHLQHQLTDYSYSGIALALITDSMVTCSNTMNQNILDNGDNRAKRNKVFRQASELGGCGQQLCLIDSKKLFDKRSLLDRKFLTIMLIDSMHITMCFVTLTTLPRVHSSTYLWYDFKNHKSTHTTKIS